MYHYPLPDSGGTGKEADLSLPKFFIGKSLNGKFGLVANPDNHGHIVAKLAGLAADVESALSP